MKHLIRKILRESAQISLDAPEWVKKFHSLSSREEKIEDIEKRKVQIGKILPNISGFFREKFGDDLEKVVIDVKSVHYGNQGYSTDVWLLKFYFDETKDSFGGNKYKREVQRDLVNFFNIDITYYAMPLHIEFYVKKWEKI